MNVLRLVHNAFLYLVSGYVIALGVLGLPAGYWAISHVWFLAFEVQVYPASLILSGLFLIGLTVRWGFYAYPVFLMTTNFFEVFGGGLFAYSLSPIQFVLALFGFALVSPKFKSNMGYLMILVFIVTERTIGYHLFEAALFLYVLYSLASVKSPFGKRIARD